MNASFVLRGLWLITDTRISNSWLITSHCLLWVQLLIHILNLMLVTLISAFNTLKLRQNGRHLPDDIFKCIFLSENVWISINISLKFVPKGPINTIPALVQIMAWRCLGDKPLSESMLVNLLTHICVTRPQWIKEDLKDYCRFHCHDEKMSHEQNVDGHNWYTNKL